MKNLYILTIFSFLITYSSIAQQSSFIQSNKILDSIVEYRYTSPEDSIRFSKVNYVNSDRGRHIVLSYFRWTESSQIWVPDFGLIHNKIDIYLDDAGNLLRETRYLWNSNTDDYTMLLQLNKDYDQNTKLVYEELEVWNMMGTSLRGHFMNFGYDAEGRLIFENKCDWTNEINNWYGKYQHEYAYDSEGNKTSHIKYGWDQLNRAWENDLMEEWDYYLSENRLEYNSYSWNLIDESWENDYQYEQSLNSEGNLTLELCHKWDSADSIWIEDKKRERTYDSDGNWIEETTYDWSAGFHQWINAARQERTFDSGGMLTTDMIYIWEQSSNDWNGYSRKDIEYDEFGNQITVLDYNWLGDAWMAYQRTNKTFDPAGNKTIEAKYLLSQDSGEWTGISHNKWAFDNDGDLNKETVFTWNSGINDWQLNSRLFYYYRSASSILDQSIGENVILYPNPGSGIINISGLSGPSEIRIYSTQGSFLKSIFQIENTIDISELPNGIYVILISCNQNIVVRKILIEK